MVDDSGSELPRLVLVSGQPGSGKSTLAREIARLTGLRCLCRDDLTAHLADLLAERAEISALSDKQPIALAAFAAFYAITSSLLKSGLGVVAETNFGRGLAEPFIAPLLTISNPVMIYCEVPRELSILRFRERAFTGHRHWFFLDAAQIERIDDGEVPEAWATAVPLDLDVPMLRVDTSDGYEPSLATIVDFVQRNVRR